METGHPRIEASIVINAPEGGEIGEADVVSANQQMMEAGLALSAQLTKKHRDLLVAAGLTDVEAARVMNFEDKPWLYEGDEVRPALLAKAKANGYVKPDFYENYLAGRE